MTYRLLVVRIALPWAISDSAFADTHYVSLGGHVVSPYTNLYDAATNISQATAVASDGDLILVSNGVCHLGTPAYIQMAPSLIVTIVDMGAYESIPSGTIPGIK